MKKTLEETVRGILSEQDLSGLPKEVTDWWQNEYVNKYKSNKFDREYALKTLSSLYDMVRNKQDTRTREFSGKDYKVQTDTFKNKNRPEYAQKFLEYLTKTQGSETAARGVGMGVRPGFPGENNAGWLGTGDTGTGKGSGTTGSNFGSTDIADRGAGPGTGKSTAGSSFGSADVGGRGEGSGGGANRSLRDIKDLQGDAQVAAQKGSTNTKAFAPQDQILPGVPSGANKTLADIKDRQADQQVKATTSTQPSTADIIANARKAVKDSEVAQFKAADSASMSALKRFEKKNSEQEKIEIPATIPVRQSDLPPANPPSDLSSKLQQWIAAQPIDKVLTSVNGKDEVPNAIDVQMISPEDFEKQFGQKAPEAPKPKTDTSAFKPVDQALPPAAPEVKKTPPSLGNTQTGIAADWRELKQTKAAAASGGSSSSAAGTSGAGDNTGGNKGEPSRDNPDNWEDWFNALAPQKFYLTKDMEKKGMTPAYMYDRELGKKFPDQALKSTVGQDLDMTFFPLYQKQLKAYLDNPNPEKKRTTWTNPYHPSPSAITDVGGNRDVGPNKMSDFYNSYYDRNNYTPNTPLGQRSYDPNKLKVKPYEYGVGSPLQESVRSRAIRRLSEQTDFLDSTFQSLQPSSGKLSQAALQGYIKKKEPKVTYPNIDTRTPLGQRMASDLDAIRASNAKDVKPIGSALPYIATMARGGRESEKPEAMKRIYRAGDQKMDLYVPYDDAVRAKNDVVKYHNKASSNLDDLNSLYNTGMISSKEYRNKSAREITKAADAINAYNFYVGQKNDALYMDQYKAGEIDLETAISNTANTPITPH